MDLFISLFKLMLYYTPLVCGAYITILILKHADLTIEASWSIGGIASCLSAHFLSSSLFSPLLGLISGAICGLVTFSIFCLVGRAKLLCSLISYLIITSIGFHLLGDKASINLDNDFLRFNNPDNLFLSMFIYFIYVVLIFTYIVFWQKSKLGIKSRLLGETPNASKFYNFSIYKYYGLGLVISNAIVGLGGGLYSINVGLASNLMGISVVIKAFFALLIGDSVMRFIKVKRVIPLVILIGTFFFVVILEISEAFGTFIQKNTSFELYKPSDVSLMIGLITVIILFMRNKSISGKNVISEW
jgi:putative tryptophan/tyrosine transport system permease protein